MSIKTRQLRGASPSPSPHPWVDAWLQHQLVVKGLSENSLAASAGLLMGIPYLALIPHWGAVTFVTAMLLIGVGFVCMHTTLQLRGTEISTAARGKAFSLFIFCLFTGMAAGSAVFGRLVDAGLYEWMFAVAGLGLIGIGFATALAPRGNAGRNQGCPTGTGG